MSDLYNLVKIALEDRIVSIVAERTGVGKNTIHQIKLGNVRKPQISTLKVLADYLGVKG